MKIQLKNAYKSFRSVVSDELPKLSILVGPNGAGKSHLLEAIEDQNIECFDEEGKLISRDQIRRFDANSFLLKNEERVTETNLANQRDRIWSELQTQRHQYQAPMLDSLHGVNNLAKSYLFEPGLLSFYGLEDIQSIVNNDVVSKSIYDSLLQVRERFAASILYNINLEIPGSADILGQVNRHCGESILTISQSDFFRCYPKQTVSGDPFSAELTQSFALYRSLDIDNKKNKIIARRRPDISFLGDDEFLSRYGSPPWDIVNSILEGAGARFVVAEPRKDVYAVEFKINIKNSLMPLSISDLSTGERILLGLARCIFYISNNTARNSPPRLLLLDEIDAPLHPAMTRYLLRALTDVVIDKYKINVLMVTHSPSTVALSPHDSVIRVNSAEGKLSNISKDSALSELTAGLPTLSVKYENRRQVFVEGKYDVEIYEAIYLQIRAELKSEVSLHFISSGSNGSGSCNQVKEQVRLLRDAGNNMIWGLIDWDHQNQSSRFVKVLGREQRYSIANYVLDPILVFMYLVRCDFLDKTEVNLPDDIKYWVVAEKSVQELQEFVDWVVKKVGRNQDLGSEQLECRLIDGKSLVVPRWYLTLNGHELESWIKEAFPMLKRFRGEAGLKLEIVNTVIKEFSGLLSLDFLEVFRDLQGDEHHSEFPAPPAS